MCRDGINLCEKINTVIRQKNKMERRELYRNEMESMKKGDK